MRPSIAYTRGYKYQLEENYTVNVGIKSPTSVRTKFLSLTPDGELTIQAGYAWDGPSGPAIDTLNFMRGSLVHDALYQMMREGFLDRNEFREPSDRVLQKICKEDGMFSLRVWWVYQGVHFGGGPATDPQNKKPVIHAPKECQKGEKR